MAEISVIVHGRPICLQVILLLIGIGQRDRFQPRARQKKMPCNFVVCPNFTIFQDNNLEGAYFRNMQQKNGNCPLTFRLWGFDELQSS